MNSNRPLDLLCGALILFLLVGIIAAAGNSGWLGGCSGKQKYYGKGKDERYPVGGVGWISEMGFHRLQARDARCDSLEYILRIIGTKLTAEGIRAILIERGYRDLWMDITHNGR